MDDDARRTMRSIPPSTSTTDGGRDRSIRSRPDRSIDRPSRATRRDPIAIRTIARPRPIVVDRAHRPRARGFTDDGTDDARRRRWVTPHVTVASFSPSSSPIGRRARVLLGLGLGLVVVVVAPARKRASRRRVAISRARVKIRFDRVVEGGGFDRLRDRTFHS